MFGEDIIMGLKEISIDPKNRITIPKFTGIEGSEEIGLVLNESFKSLYIMKKEEVDKFIKQLIKENGLEEEYLFDLEKRRVNYQINNSYDYVTTDKQCRINLPSRFISSLQIENKAFVIGENHHLVLCKDVDAYLSNEEEKRSL
jgi:DNA-binding transcriptional regulator/RsmH inhibitor MraZ